MEPQQQQQQQPQHQPQQQQHQPQQQQQQQPSAQSQPQQQQFCLRWNNHQNTLISVFDTLLESGSLTDCALAAEGQCLNAHKVVLSACSPYFAMLLNQHYDKYPVLILKDVTYQELRSMMDYMYRGEVNITQEQLGSFLKAAESLQIKGLTESSSGRSDRKLDTRKSIARNISPGLPKKSVTPKINDSAFEPSMPIPVTPPLPTTIQNIPNTKRRKLVQPVKNFNSLVVSPVNPSRTNANNLDVNNTPNPTAPSLAGEGKANIPSPPIIPKPVVESANFQSEEDQPQPDVNGVVVEEKDDAKYWPSNCLVNEIKVEKTDTEEEASESDNNAHGEMCPTNTYAVHSVPSSQIGANNFRPEEGIEHSEYGGMSIPPPMQDQAFTLGGSLWWKNFEQNSKYVRTTQANPFSCQHCGKRYRWKSTLKRHEVFECGGKEPVHRCPHCEYRAKQSGNLRVHIRKYHTSLE